MKLRFANVVALLVGFAMVVQALPAGAGQFKAAQLKTAGQVRSEESKAKSPVKDPLPAADPDWDPKDPAAVQYADGAWGIAYVDNANPPNLLFRRSLGGGDPQYWRDQLTVESAAERPSMVQLGGTTALFYGKMSGGVREAFLKTSTDDGATWSSPTQLTSGSPAHVYEINTVNVDGTIHMFYSLSNTSGQLQYKTSSDLANWSAASTVGQPIGPLQSSTIPTFDIEMLASGEWAMSWLNVSIAGGGGQPINDLGWPVVWFGKSADLASSSWSNKSELMAGSPFGMRFPKSVTLAQDSAGTVKVAFESQRYPSDQYIYAVSSADAGTTFTGAELVGYEPTRSTNGSGDSYARRPYAVATNEGPVRLFWDMEVPIWAGSYPAQLFRRDLTPGAGITQISVSKEQMAKCGPCVPTGAFVADPINATTGNFTLPETDFMIPGKGPSLSFTRTYNAHRLVDSPLGFGWTHNFAESVQTFSRGEALVIDGTGRNDLYTPKAGGGYDPPPGRFATLVQNPDTTFTLTETDFTVKTFNQDGHLSSITDRFGNSLSLAYDPGQELTSVTDESGRTLTFAYQGNRISTITDPLNRTVGYGYSPAGDLISITDPRAKVWTHTYNANHQMLTKKDPNNNTVLTNTYVSLGRVGTQTDARGGVTRFDYNAGGGRTDVVNPRGHTTHYYFDTSYRVTKIYDQNLKMINRFYDDRDNLIRVEDRRRSPFNNTYFTYDSRGNVLTRKDGLNKTWTYTYNAFNQVLTETDPMGRVTTNTYDGNGNLTSTKNAKNQTTTFGVGAWGQVSSVTDANSNITGFGYDAYGNQTTVTNPLGKVWTTTFDLAGRKTKVTDPLTHETSFAYNPNDDLTSVTDARSKVTSFGYDNAGNRTSTTDPNNKVTGFGYDAKNRLETVTDAEGGVTTYSYDGNDNLLSVKDANNHTRSYTYDIHNNQLTEKDALNNITAFAYDPAGNRTKRTDAKGQVTTYAYDAINRLTGVTYPAGQGSVTYGYNTSDAVTSMTDSTGTTTYTLDELYRPSSITMPGSRVVGYLYDPAGNRTRITYPDSKQVNYAYDDAGRMDTVTDWASGVTDYDYDSAGRLTTTTLPNGVVQTSTYNSADQLTGIEAVKGGTTLTDFGYTLDNAGMRTAVNTPAGLESYSYDDLYRLTGVTYPDSSTQAYTYDNVGNRQTKVEGSTTSYTYDLADRMTTAGGVTYTYDNNGNQTGRGADVFGWDIEDRLTSATVGGNAVSYTYRGDDLRHSKSEAGVTTVYTWDLAAELPVVLQEGNTSYVYGLGLISQTTGTTTSYPLADGLGSTAALTDALGAVTATYTYDVFGAVKSSTGPGSTEFRFAGQQDDPALGYQYLRARYYDPAIGRFISKDPLGGTAADSQSQNAYVYVQNSPANLIDPTGEVGVKATRALNVIGDVATVVSLVPGPVGMIAGGIGVAANLAVGDYRGAGIAALGMVGGGAIGCALTKLRGVTKLGNLSAHSKILGLNSRLFGRGNAYTKGLLNRGPLRVGWGPFSKTETAFRIGIGKAGTKHIDILRSLW